MMAMTLTTTKCLSLRSVPRGPLAVLPAHLVIPCLLLAPRMLLLAPMVCTVPLGLPLVLAVLPWLVPAPLVLASTPLPRLRRRLSPASVVAHAALKVWHGLRGIGVV
jgi:hypothetical protein